MAFARERHWKAKCAHLECQCRDLQDVIRSQNDTIARLQAGIEDLNNRVATMHAGILESEKKSARIMAEAADLALKVAGGDSHDVDAREAAKRVLELLK